MTCLNQKTQHLRVKVSTSPKGTQQSASAFRSDSYVVLATTSDDLMGGALHLELWHCQATMTSDRINKE